MAVNSLVPEYIVQDLFEELRVFERVRKGCLEEHELHEQTQPAKMCEGVSYFTRIEEPNGDFAARVHYVWCSETGVLHVFPTAIRVGDVNIHRRDHQQRPSGM